MHLQIVQLNKNSHKNSYRNNFKPSSQLSKPYVLLCVVIAADTDQEASATSIQKTFLGIITGNRQQLQTSFRLGC
jgi:hypothetical protein